MAGPVPHLLDGDRILARVQSASGAHQSLASPGRVSIPTLRSSGEFHLSPKPLPQRPENKEPEENLDVNKNMRHASM